MNVQDIVSDKQLEEQFRDTNFGDMSTRDIIRYSLLKYASGYTTGFTARSILISLELLRPLKRHHALTKKGKIYLFEAFSNGHSL